MPELQLGSIVWAQVQCRHTGNWKPRPAIIATNTDEIRASESLVAIACSRSAAQAAKPWPDHYVELPFHPTRNVSTKLRYRTVALCDWVFELERKHIEDFIGGYVKCALLETILEKAGL